MHFSVPASVFGHEAMKDTSSNPLFYLFSVEYIHCSHRLFSLIDSHDFVELC